MLLYLKTVQLLPRHFARHIMKRKSEYGEKDGVASLKVSQYSIIQTRTYATQCTSERPLDTVNIFAIIPSSHLPSSVFITVAHQGPILPAINRPECMTTSFLLSFPSFRPFSYASFPILYSFSVFLSLSLFCSLSGLILTTFRYCLSALLFCVLGPFNSLLLFLTYSSLRYFVFTSLYCHMILLHHLISFRELDPCYFYWLWFNWTLYWFILFLQYFLEIFLFFFCPHRSSIHCMILWNIVTLCRFSPQCFFLFYFSRFAILFFSISLCLSASFCFSVSFRQYIERQLHSIGPADCAIDEDSEESNIILIASDTPLRTILWLFFSTRPLQFFISSFHQQLRGFEYISSLTKIARSFRSFFYDPTIFL